MDRWWLVVWILRIFDEHKTKFIDSIVDMFSEISNEQRPRGLNASIPVCTPEVLDLGVFFWMAIYAFLPIRVATIVAVNHFEPFFAPFPLNIFGLIMINFFKQHFPLFLAKQFFSASEWQENQLQVPIRKAISNHDSQI